MEAPLGVHEHILVKFMFESKVTPILGGTSWQLVQDTAFDSRWRNPEATTWLIPEG